MNSLSRPGVLAALFALAPATSRSRMARPHGTPALRAPSTSMPTVSCLPPSTAVGPDAYFARLRRRRRQRSSRRRAPRRHRR